MLVVGLLVAGAGAVIARSGDEEANSDGARPRRDGPSSTTPGDTAPPPSDSPPAVGLPDLADVRGYLATPERLGQVVRRARAGDEPEATAVRDLLDFVRNRAIDEDPDPEDPIDTGDTAGPLVDDTTNAYALALAYGVTADAAYARRAGEIVNAWVETARSTENTCTDTGGCTTSLILSRGAPGFVFPAALVGTAGMTADERDAFDEWLRDLILPAASERENNWGDAGTFMRVVVTDWLGDDEGFEDALDAWRSGMDLVAEDGHLPEETRRGKSGLQYTQEALSYRVAVATIAERRGVDLWDHRGSEGASLRDAVDYLLRYWEQPEEWPHHGNVEVPNEGPMWEQVYAHWRDCASAERVEAGRPFGRKGNSAVRWTTVTDAAPVEECSGSG